MYDLLKYTIMKKILLLAVTFCMIAVPAAMAQSRETVKATRQNQQVQRTIKGESTANRPVKYQKVNKNNSQQTVAPKSSQDNTRVRRPAEAEVIKDKALTQQKSGPKSIQKQNVERVPVDNEVVKDKTLTQQEAAMREKITSERERLSFECRDARLKLNNAQGKMETEQRNLQALIEKQQKEKALLAEKQEREAAGGLTDEMRKRHEAEISNLEARHARELMDAQLAVDNAKRAYEECQLYYENARNALLEYDR